MSKKVLYYNWCPINEKQGGGIVVYQKNILNELEKDFPDVDPYFLSAGFFYDDSSEMYIRREAVEGRKNIYSIVNSSIYSPIQSPIDNIEKMLHNDAMLNLFRTFLVENGPFAAIHFETLEGLPVTVGSLKEEFKNTVFIVSAHNYTLVCPNVQLWTDKNKNCMLSERRNCEKCLMKYSRPSTTHLKSFRMMKEKGKDKMYYLSRVYTKIRRDTTKRISSNELQRMQTILSDYRRACVETVNNDFDYVLAVSKRVRDILVFHGIDPQKVKVSYIGTKFASLAQYKSNKPYTDTTFGIVYMGYMRIEKGFYFFLDALEKMDDNVADRIDITFASKIQDLSACRRMNKLKKKFRSIKIYNGYTHDDIVKIVNSNSLGVVPVMWEDNLPQVTIEMIANGLPVLASSFGGASELNSSKEFVYEGGNVDDFLNKVVNIYNNRDLLNKYWETSLKLTSMQDHVSELIDYYGLEG